MSSAEFFFKHMPGIQTRHGFVAVVRDPLQERNQLKVNISADLFSVSPPPPRHDLIVNLHCLDCHSDWGEP